MFGSSVSCTDGGLSFSSKTAQNLFKYCWGCQVGWLKNGFDLITPMIISVSDIISLGYR